MSNPINDPLSVAAQCAILAPALATGGCTMEDSRQSFYKVAALDMMTMVAMHTKAILRLEEEGLINLDNDESIMLLDRGRKWLAEHST